MSTFNPIAAIAAALLMPARRTGESIPPATAKSEPKSKLPRATNGARLIVKYPVNGHRP